jgi:prolyl 4-hydroxylase
MPWYAVQGEKWSATLWIHVDAFGQDASYQLAKWKGCADRHENCAYWAKNGECDKNPAYMNNACKLACKKCDPAKDGEKSDAAAAVGKAAAAA